MDVRMGAGRVGATQQVLEYGERPSAVGDVRVWMQPAGHVLGSAQVAMEWRGSRAVVVSGDYKRQPDPTCRPFEPIRLRRVRDRGDVRPCRCSAIRPAADEIKPSCWPASPCFPDRTHVDRRVCAGQGAAGDRPAAGGRVGPADLLARGADPALRGL